MDIGLRRALTVAGSVSALARMLKLTRQSIAVWEKIPAERVVDVERVTGVPRHMLRPDLHLPPSYQAAE